MIGFRVLQAIPGGVLPVVSLSMLYQIVPKERIGSAMGLYGLGVVVAPAVGPTLGGYLVEYVDWRLIFFINVPIGIMGAIAAYLLLPAFPGRPAGRFDVLGFVTIASGLSALLLALSEGQSWGWTAYPTVILIILGFLCIALFVVIELEVDNPLLDVRVFRVWPYTNSLLLIAVLSIGLFSVLFYIPVYLQQARGLGAFEAGLVLMPQALVMAVLMPIAGQIYDRIGARVPAVVGLLIMTVASYLMQDLTAVTSQEEIIALLCLRAFGTGLCMMPIMTSGISAVPAAIVGSASAFNNVAQRSVVGPRARRAHRVHDHHPSSAQCRPRRTGRPQDSDAGARSGRGGPGAGHDGRLSADADTGLRVVARRRHAHHHGHERHRARTRALPPQRAQLASRCRTRASRLSGACGANIGAEWSLRSEHRY